jgi:hypothetical protein
MPVDESTRSAAHSPADDNVPASSDEAVQALRNGPIGAYLVASIAVGLLFLGWLAFYFLLFMPRGSIG